MLHVKGNLTIVHQLMGECMDWQDGSILSLLLKTNSISKGNYN